MATKLFSTLPRDGNQVAIQAGSAILTADISGTPKTSPLAIDTNVTTIAVPTNACEMVLLSDVAIRISEVVGMGQYFTANANMTIAIGVGNMANLYIRAGSGSGTLQFYFITV